MVILICNSRNENIWISILARRKRKRRGKGNDKKTGVNGRKVALCLGDKRRKKEEEYIRVFP